MTQRNALNAMAGAAGQAAQGAALGRAQEGMNAINQYGQNANAMRNTSINQAVSGAQNDIAARDQQTRNLGMQQDNANQTYQNALGYERARAGSAQQGYQDMGNAVKGGSSVFSAFG